MQSPTQIVISELYKKSDSDRVGSTLQGRIVLISSVHCPEIPSLSSDHQKSGPLGPRHSRTQSFGNCPEQSARSMFSPHHDRITSIPSSFNWSAAGAADSGSDCRPHSPLDIGEVMTPPPGDCTSSFYVLRGLSPCTVWKHTTRSQNIRIESG
jgi:hypothetical protein